MGHRRRDARLRLGIGAQLQHQIGAQFFLRGRVLQLIAGAIDQKPDLVVALQQQRAELGRQCQLAVAALVEQGLDVVRELNDLVQAKYAG